MIMNIVKEADEVNGCTTDNRLRSLIERIERLEEEKRISQEILEIFMQRQKVQATMQKL